MVSEVLQCAVCSKKVSLAAVRENSLWGQEQKQKQKQKQTSSEVLE